MSVIQQNTISTNSITEATSANGVSIDGLKVKDYSLMYGSNIGLTVSSDGYVNNPNIPYFMGKYNVGNVNVTGQYNAVKFTGYISNNAIVQNASTGKCSIPVAGKYMVNWTVGNQGSGNNSAYVGIYIFKNTGSEVGAWSDSTGYDHTAHCHIILDLSTSDTVAFTYRTDHGAPPNNELTMASIYLIG